MSEDSFSRDLLAKLLLPRPRGQLRSLPPKLRWEVTRRHPIYMSCWRLAQSYWDNGQQAGTVVPELQQLAVELLWRIGVSRGAPDPGLEFDVLGEGLLRNGWPSGAIAPLELRGLLALLIAYVPSDQFVEAVVRITRDMCMEPNEEKRKDVGIRSLINLKMPELDQLIVEPFISVNPRFSSRQIKKELDELLSQWRNEREIPETRDRSDRQLDYLRVWDLREGWTNGDYDNTKELTFKEVAKVTGDNLTTVTQQYRSAFELITGHAYSPEMWFRFMQFSKVSEATCRVIGRVTRARPQVSPTPRDVPSSVLNSGEREDFVANRAESRDSVSATELSDFRADMTDLIKCGKSNQEILQKFGLTATPEYTEVIEVYRRHLDIPGPSGHSEKPNK